MVFMEIALCFSERYKMTDKSVEIKSDTMKGLKALLKRKFIITTDRQETVYVIKVMHCVD